MLSKNYVNEMVQLASCIEKKLKVVKKYWVYKIIYLFLIYYNNLIIVFL